jgi:WD40 repeat protein
LGLAHPGGKRVMAELKTLVGILALVDVVNFTAQSVKLGEKYSAKYTDYFQEKIKIIAERYDFQAFKPIGDAVLLFGKTVEDLLEIMLDLFHRNRLEDKDGFTSKLRMVAHIGFFQFLVENDRPVDLVSPEGIKVFRLEKEAQSWEMVVTQPLYQGIKALLTSRRLEALRLVLKEPLKGFDSEEWSSPFYKLRISQEQTGNSNLLERRFEELERSVQTIPVFGNIYSPVPMEKNFVNLAMICDREFVPGPEAGCEPSEGLEVDYRGVGKEKRKGGKGDWPFYDGEPGPRAGDRPREITVSVLYESYRCGLILGLPGAGKTTILRYLAYREFEANRDKPDPHRQLVLFVPCRDIPLYETWYRLRHQVEPPVPNPDDVLAFLAWVFLMSKTVPDTAVAPEHWVEYQAAVQQVITAFKENRLTLLVDALDEAPDLNIRERIKQLFLILYSRVSQNRLFLTSRPSEGGLHLTREFAQQRVPVFKVLSLTMEQVRDVARHILAGDSPEYKKFDTAIWQEEVVVKMAVTPITALLVTAYFQAYEKFDHRYPMYDLLMKFILLKAWDAIKTDTFPYKNLDLFFQEVKDPDFFERQPEAAILYDALASLCYHLFYDSADDKVRRSVHEETLLLYFSQYIRDRRPYYSEETARAEAARWRDRFQQDHLLLQAGPLEYVFVHATVMEFLAAYYLVRQSLRGTKELPGLVKDCVEKENFLELETVPLAAGSSLVTGYDIMTQLRELVSAIDYGKDLFYGLAVKCLSEVEWLLHKTLKGLEIKSLKGPIMDIVKKNRSSVHWVYVYLKGLILTPDKEVLRQALRGFDPQMRLSQDLFFMEYLDYPAFDTGDSEIVGLRKELLGQLIQKGPLDTWLKSHEAIESMPLVKGLAVENFLQFDSDGYHPEDKNFGYYRKIIGKELIGFLGSPNFKHRGSVTCVVVSPDGRYILSGSSDSTLKLWDVATGKEIRTFKGHKGRVWSAAFSPGGTTLVSGSEDKTLKLWDIGTGREIRTFRGHQREVLSVAFGQGGTTLVSGSADTTLKLWDVATGREIRTFMGHRANVWSAAFGPGGTTMVSGSADSTLKLWDVTAGKAIRTLTGHKGSVLSTTFSPGGTTLVSGSDDKTLKLWDVGTGKEIRTFRGHEGIVFSTVFDPGGTTLVSGSADTTLKLWDVVTGQEIRAFRGHSDWVRGVAFVPNETGGTTLVSGSSDKTLKLWNVTTGQEIRTFQGHQREVWSTEFDPKGTTLVSGSSDATMRLWNMGKGQEILTFTGHEGRVWSVAFATEGFTLVSGSSDNTLKLWDVDTGKEIRTLYGHSDAVRCTAFGPGGTTLVSGSSDATLKLWNVATGKEILTFKGHRDGVLCAAFGPGGLTLVSGSADSTLKLWDVAAGKEIRTLQGHKGWVRCAAFDPGGTTLLSCSEDKNLKLWDVVTGKVIRTFKGHKGSVWSATFDIGETTLISASEDFTLKLWDVATGKCIKTIPLLWIPLHISAAPHRPGLFATANSNGTVTLFDLSKILAPGSEKSEKVSAKEQPYEQQR